MHNLRHGCRALARRGVVVGLALLLTTPAIVALAQTPQPAPASTGLPTQVSAAINKMTATLAEAEKALQNLSELEEELGGLRTRVEEVLSDTTDTAEDLRPKLAAVKLQIEKLGPPPGKDAAPESAQVAAERAALAALAAAYDGAIKTSELTWVRARQLIERITVMRHSLFTKNLMERLPSPLLPGVWRDLSSAIPGVWHRFSYALNDWWYWASRKGSELWMLLGSAAALYVVLKAIAWRTARRKHRTETDSAPAFFERALSAAGIAPLRALPIIAAVMLIYGGLDGLGLLYSPWSRPAGGIVKGVLVFAAVSALLHATLAPGDPNWRLAPLSDHAARRITRLLSAMTAVYAIDGALTEVARAFFVPLALSVAQSFIMSATFAGLLVALLLAPFTPQSIPAAGYPRSRPAWLKLPLWVVAIGIVAAALTGYVALARFVSQQLVLTGIILLLMWLGFLAIRAFTREPAQRGLPVRQMLEQRFGLDEPRRHQLARLTEFALTLGLIICALPFLMLQWGFSGADVRDWLKSLLFGIEIGQFRISLVRILGGILLFIGLLLATRLVQRFLRERAIQSRMDTGIANSIETVVGYAGMAIAGLVAVSYAGLDITNFAIVAGALSVGIGFGLQSIVNNFVSGLILLIERPIKVGDRIVVGDQQGHVRRISVRATEVETFDRASLIIPNSELITGRVLNWTHRDSLGAVNVKVGVGYNADPARVIAILKQCAEAHPQVLRSPEPNVALEAFGDSALLFNVRVSLPNVDQAGAVQSDLRVAIFKALGEAGIEIPFNQVDVNLRDLEAIKSYVDSALAERPNGADRNTRSRAT
jgi:potassium-dependent mechanosensitive channel